jgi:hypothetical protein
VEAAVAFAAVVELKLLHVADDESLNSLSIM